VQNWRGPGRHKHYDSQTAATAGVSTSRLLLTAAISVGLVVGPAQDGCYRRSAHPTNNGGCNDEGECWHIKGKADFYKREHGVHIYPDSWKWGEKEHFKWREHEGRGYWKGGVWIVL
jgi:hypothetical protein